MIKLLYLVAVVVQPARMQRVTRSRTPITMYMTYLSAIYWCLAAQADDSDRV